MASVAKVPTGWRARWRTPAGASRSQTFARKIDAERHLTGVEHSKLVGGYVDPAEGKITFRTYAEAWRARQPHRAQTAASTETHLRLHAYPVLGDRPIASIRRSEMQAWAKAVGTTLAPGTVVTVRQKVNAVFAAAMADRLITLNPCTGLRLPRPAGKQVHPLAHAEVVAMAEAVPARYRPLILAGAGTGMRQGELLGLTVDRVDFLRRTLRVDRQMLTTVGERPHFAPTKTVASVRTIPVPSVVLEEITAHLQRFGAGQDGLVFTADGGGPVRRNYAGRVWRAAAKRAGVEGRSFHDLRHYCASVLIASGASVKVVQHHLGHATASQTLDVYSHLWSEDEDRTRTALEAALRAAVSPACHEAPGQEG